MTALVRAFATTKPQAEALRDYGIPARHLYLQGRGAEDLDRCLDTFRGRPGQLVIAQDLTVFGQTKKLVSAVMTRLERARIRVLDIIHPQHETHAELLRHADNIISRRRFTDRRTARRRGRKGGLVRGADFARKRDEIAADWFLRNLVNDADIPWAALTRCLEGHISEATLRRRYLGGA